MRPKDLKAPFRWVERRVVLQEEVLYVPDLCDHGNWLFPGWAELFGNSHPIHVEYCAGNGEWVVNKALDNADVNWVAVEKRFDRVRQIWSKGKNAGVENLLIVCGEAHQVTRLYFPRGSVEAVYINFPDPWPKQRHAKHRLIHSPFVGEVRRILVEEGTLTFVTDDPEYAQRFLDQMEGEEGFALDFTRDELPGYGGSWFERLWREKGKTIRYTRYQKRLPCAV